MKTGEYQAATPESVWMALRELAERQAETDRQMKETDRQMKENAQLRKEAEERFDRELAKSSADFDRRMKNLDEMIGGMANSNGMFAEEFFFNSIDSGDKNLFGEHFDECYSSLKRYNKGKQKKSEHDILLVNGKAVAIVEVKYKARKEDVEKLISKLPDFRELYPQYQSHRTYLGLAAMSFEDGVENESAQNGVAIIKQVGDTVVINDEHLKVF